MKYEPRHLWDEIQAAEKVRDSFLYSLEDMVKRYHQPAYREDCQNDKFEPENHAFEANALNVAQITFNNPRAIVKPGRPATHRDVAKALQFGLNRWSEKTRFREPTQLVCLDTQFAYGVFMTTQDRIPGYDRQGGPVPHWPMCERLSQWQFFFDPLCTMFGKARYAGHYCPHDKQTLIETATNQPELGWNAELLNDLGTTKEFDHRDRSMRDTIPDRDEIKIYEMWCPNYNLPESQGPEEGFHGTIFTLVDGQSNTRAGDEWIRQPRPAYVPRWGSYALAGMYAVPDLAFPLAPLMAVEGQVREFNSHASAMAQQMQKYKKLVLVSSDRTDLIQKMNRSNSLVIPVAGFRKDEVAEFEIGGITEQHLTMRAVMRERLDRNSGISDAQRGNVKGGTATANAIADEAATVRLGFMKQRMQEAVRQVFESAAEYMLRDDRVVFPLGEDAAQEFGQAEPYFHGGQPEGMDPVSVDDLDISIEPYSMDQLGQGLQRQQFLESLNVLLGMVPMVRQYPEVKWKDLFGKLGDMNNDPDWGRMIDADIAAMLGGMPAGQPATPQPVMAGALSRSAQANVVELPPMTFGQPQPAGAEAGGGPNQKGQRRGGQSGKRAATGRTLN